MLVEGVWSWRLLGDGARQAAGAAGAPHKLGGFLGRDCDCCCCDNTEI